MRRVILAVTGTIAGLVALLSFKSHVPSSPVAATAGGPGSVAKMARSGVMPTPPASRTTPRPDSPGVNAP